MRSPIANAVATLTKRLPVLRRLPGKRAAQHAVRALDLSILFARLVIARHQAPPVRFFIFGQGRSGSTLLVDLLNSSSEVYCEGEILERSVPFPAAYVRARSTVSPKPIYGFKVKIYQLTSDQGLRDPRRFLDVLHRDGWKVIYLWRANVLRQAMSNVIAERRQLYQITNGQPSPAIERMAVDVDLLMRRMQGRTRFLRDEADVLRDFPHVAVQYERDLLDSSAHQRTLDRLFDFLSTPRVPVSTRLARINDRRLSELVSNFDEVRARLGGTEYEGLLVGE
jgi:LPS sulfotransferase NodH